MAVKIYSWVVPAIDCFDRSGNTTFETGVTARRFVVLDAIARLTDVEPSQSDICAETGIDRSTLAEVVQRLVTRRLITRRRSQTDAKAYTLRHTEVGMRCLDDLHAKIGAAEVQVMSDLPKSQRNEFIALLQIIAAQPLASPSRRM